MSVAQSAADLPGHQHRPGATPSRSGTHHLPASAHIVIVFDAPLPTSCKRQCLSTSLCPCLPASLTRNFHTRVFFPPPHSIRRPPSAHTRTAALVSVHPRGAHTLSRSVFEILNSCRAHATREPDKVNSSVMETLNGCFRRDRRGRRIVPWYDKARRRLVACSRSFAISCSLTADVTEPTSHCLLLQGVDGSLDAPREPRSFDYTSKFTELINRKKDDASCVIA